MNEIILLVEDNPKVSFLNREILEEEGYTVITAYTIAQAVKQFRMSEPDIIILDIAMPDGSGLDFLEYVRKTSTLPVLMLTGFSRDEDIVSGFNRGCDDYLAKPYSVEVLLVRIRRLLSVSKRLITNITIANLSLDLSANKAYVNNTDLLLTPKDFAILKLLVQNEDQILTIEKIFGEVWGNPLAGDTRAVVSAISRLRKKIVDSGCSITAVYRVGYKFTRD